MPPATSRFETFGRRVDEHIGAVPSRVEEELRRVTDYLNDEVVPQVRQSSSNALRTAAQQLARLADHLKRSTSTTSSAGRRR